jgi:hypothetical protein
MKEEFFPKRGMGTGMGNTLDGWARCGKVSSDQSPPRYHWSQESEQEYISADSVCKSDTNSEIHSEWLTTEFLNDIKSISRLQRVFFDLSSPAGSLKSKDLQKGSLLQFTSWHCVTSEGCSTLKVLE